MVTPAELLAEEANWALLQQLQLQVGGTEWTGGDWQQLGEYLRESGTSGALAAAITSQLALRGEAEAKFGDSASHMLLTRDGLEQATRFAIAFLHAARFRACGVTSVADLGCGIGADAVALATSGIRVLAVDRDPAAVACAAANLRPFPQSQVIRGDIADVSPGWLAQKGVEAIFLDPARRTEGRRIFDPQKWSPSWSRVREIFSWDFPTGVKMAPGISHADLNFGGHAQWVSDGGDLVEALLWSDHLRPAPGGRSALLLREGKQHLLSDPNISAASSAEPAAPTGALNQFLFEPDPSIIRSGNLAYLAEKTDTHTIHPRIAYLSADSLPSSPFLTPFKVDALTSLRKKAIVQELLALDAGFVEVKKRGAQIDPNRLQRELQAGLDRSSKNSFVVFATRVGKEHKAVIASRIPEH